MEIMEIERIVSEANRSEIHRRTGISLSGVSRILSANRTARSTNLHLVALQLGVPMDELYAYLQQKRTQRLRRVKSRRSKKEVA